MIGMWRGLRFLFSLRYLDATKGEGSYIGSGNLEIFHIYLGMVMGMGILVCGWVCRLGSWLKVGGSGNELLETMDE